MLPQLFIFLIVNHGVNVGHNPCYSFYFQIFFYNESNLYAMIDFKKN